MGQIEDSASGIRLAKEIALERARGNDARVLELVNTSEQAAARWALAYLPGVLWEVTMTLADRDAEAALAMLEEHFADEEDVIDTQLRLLTEGED